MVILAHVCGGQRTTFGILRHSLTFSPYFWKETGFPTVPDPGKSDTMAHCISNAGITGVHTCARVHTST